MPLFIENTANKKEEKKKKKKDYEIWQLLHKMLLP